MVLNSLTSPGMVAATLSTLGCGARFAEIGKRDIWSPARSAQERPDVRCASAAVPTVHSMSIDTCMQLPTSPKKWLSLFPGHKAARGHLLS